MAYTLEDSQNMRAHWASMERYGPESPMNIFYLDPSPREAARAHCDAHCVKMILETAQILSAVWHVTCPKLLDSGWYPPAGDVLPPGEAAWLHYRLAGQRIYRLAHAAHPCVAWARASTGNYRWLHRLGMELLDEYEYRYGRKHATAPVLWTLEAVPPGLSEEPMWEPPAVMPEELIIVADGYVDAVASYRNYYVEAKQALLRWRRRGPPQWIRAEEGKFTLTEPLTSYQG